MKTLIREAKQKNLNFHTIKKDLAKKQSKKDPQPNLSKKVSKIENILEVQSQFELSGCLS